MAERWYDCLYIRVQSGIILILSQVYHMILSLESDVWSKLGESPPHFQHTRCLILLSLDTCRPWAGRAGPSVRRAFSLLFTLSSLEMGICNLTGSPALVQVGKNRELLLTKLSIGHFTLWQVGLSNCLFMYSCIRISFINTFQQLISNIRKLFQITSHYYGDM